MMEDAHSEVPEESWSPPEKNLVSLKLASKSGCWPENDADLVVQEVERQGSPPLEGSLVSMK